MAIGAHHHLAQGRDPVPRRVLVGTEAERAEAHLHAAVVPSSSGRLVRVAARPRGGKAPPSSPGNDSHTTAPSRSTAMRAGASHTRTSRAPWRTIAGGRATSSPHPATIERRQPSRRRGARCTDTCVMTKTPAPAAIRSRTAIAIMMPVLPPCLCTPVRSGSSIDDSASTSAELRAVGRRRGRGVGRAAAAGAGCGPVGPRSAGRSMPRSLIHAEVSTKCADRGWSRLRPARTGRASSPASSSPTSEVRRWSSSLISASMSELLGLGSSACASPRAGCRAPASRCRAPSPSCGARTGTGRARRRGRRRRW